MRKFLLRFLVLSVLVTAVWLVFASIAMAGTSAHFMPCCFNNVVHNMACCIDKAMECCKKYF